LDFLERKWKDQLSLDFGDESKITQNYPKKIKD